MKRVAAGLLLVVMFSQATWAQEWSAVTALKRGSSVRVDFKDGKTWKGKFDSASAEKLSFRRRSVLTDVARPEIAKLYRTQGSIKKATAIGAGIGAGTGATLGFIGGEPCSGQGWCLFSRRDTTAIGAILGAGFGAGVGLIFGVVGKKKTAVYVAR